VRIQKTPTERMGHANAAIVGGGAAHCQHNACHAELERGIK
jgi:hypothetical protein